MDTADFTAARQAMVETQIAASGVTDLRLLAAFRRVPRDLFVPAQRRQLSYSDAHHPLGEGRFLPAPAVFAKLLQLARIQPTDRVLDCWPGSGYSTAIITGLAREVVAVEPDATLAQTCEANLEALDITNAQVLCADARVDEPGLFDVIIIEGALAEVPQPLFEKLAPGGRLVALLRNCPIGMATLHELVDGSVMTHVAFNASLPGSDLSPVTERYVF